MIPYLENLNKMQKYLSSNLAGGFEIKFLPFSGGVDEQPYIWDRTITKIIDALNSMK